MEQRCSLGKLLVKVVRSGHISENNVHLDAIECKLSQRDESVLDDHEILNSGCLLHFGLQFCEEADSLKQAVKGGDKKVQI